MVIEDALTHSLSALNPQQRLSIGVHEAKVVALVIIFLHDMIPQNCIDGLCHRLSLSLFFKTHARRCKKAISKESVVDYVGWLKIVP